MNKTHLTMLPQQLQLELEAGEDILQALRRAGVATALESPCNGKHTCGKCRITVKDGSVLPPTERERALLTPGELSRGIRLACLTNAVSAQVPITIEISSSETSEILGEGFMPEYELKPSVTRRRFCFSDPDAETQNVSSRTLFDEFRRVTGTPLPSNDLTLLRQLAAIDDGPDVEVIYYRDKPILLRTAAAGRKLLGVAFDIGTTTVAGSLLDLECGTRLAQAAGMNPQAAFGADVLSRIEHATHAPDGLKALQSLIAGCLNDLTRDMLRKAGLDAGEVCCFSVAANTTMLHLLLGVPPQSIAMAPYHPVFTELQVLPAEALGLDCCAPGAVLCCLPSVSGYIGADILAGIDIAGLAGAQDTILFIDIGTNGELVLSRRGALSACSCAAGPALEGMNISCGMRAAEGAIENAAIGENGFELDIIGGKDPLGICGSGVLSVVSTLLEHGFIDGSGRVADPGTDTLKGSIAASGRSSVFILSGGDKPVCFTQADIRQVQLAKGAILSGVMALLTSDGLTPADVDSVLVAGQFGAHLTEDSLLGSGLLPPEFRGKIRYLGNTSLSGAELFLLDSAAGGRMAGLSADVSYLELATYPNYARLLMRSMTFPNKNKG